MQVAHLGAIIASLWLTLYVTLKVTVRHTSLHSSFRKWIQRARYAHLLFTHAGSKPKVTKKTKKSQHPVIPAIEPKNFMKIQKVFLKQLDPSNSRFLFCKNKCFCAISLSYVHSAN